MTRGERFEPALAAMLEALPFAALLLGADGSILAANSSFEHATGGPTVGSFFKSLGSLPGVPEIGAAFQKDAPQGTVDTSFDTRLPNDVYGGTRVHLRSVQGTVEPLVLAVLLRNPADLVVRDVIERLESQLSELGRIRHEISNPLMGLIGTAELLEQEPGLSERVRKRIETILGESRRIKDRLGDLDRLRQH